MPDIDHEYEAFLADNEARTESGNPPITLEQFRKEQAERLLAMSPPGKGGVWW